MCWNCFLVWGGGGGRTLRRHVPPVGWSYTVLCITARRSVLLFFDLWSLLSPRADGVTSGAFDYCHLYCERRYVSGGEEGCVEVGGGGLWNGSVRARPSSAILKTFLVDARKPNLVLA